MRFQLDEQVVFESKLMRIWDYSPRLQEYTLIHDVNGDQQRYQATEEQISHEIEKTRKHHAGLIARIIPSAEWEVNQPGNGYSIQRDLGRYFVKAYQIGLMYSGEFYKRTNR